MLASLIEGLRSSEKLDHKVYSAGIGKDISFRKAAGSATAMVRMDDCVKNLRVSDLIPLLEEADVYFNAAAARLVTLDRIVRGEATFDRIVDPFAES